jgi:Tfp pilus assembly protein PilN
MKAVNLIPVDARRAGSGQSSGLQVPTYIVLGLLAGALVLVVLYVLAGNSISSRKSQLADLQTQVTQEQALASRLDSYAQFAQVAQTRISTVKSIAATRFDWNAALTGLAQVVPANTSLQSLTGSVVPGASSGASASSGQAGGLRGDINAPAFELAGCTANQDDVARLMSRLRLIDGVTRVTLGDAQKPSAVTSSAAASQGCGPHSPTFDLVVFFKPIPNAGATGPTSVAGQGAAGATGASTPGTPATSTTTAPSGGSAS